MTKIEFIPLGDSVIIEPVTIKDKTAGGLFIPDASKTQLPKGIILAAGPGKNGQDMQVAIGDEVLYHSSAGTMVELDEGTFLMMGQFEIKGILKKAAKSGK